MENRQKLLWDFVVKSHGDQVRKYTGEPYTNHLKNVAEIACQYTDQPWVWEAAILHDILEDTNVTSEELRGFLESIGYSEWVTSAIVKRVQELTDEFTKENYPHLNRRERKELEARRLGGISPVSQSIKYADFLDNISTIGKYDPGFARTYVKEKIKILDMMRMGNIELLIAACAAIHETQLLVR